MKLRVIVYHIKAFLLTFKRDPLGMIRNGIKACFWYATGAVLVICWVIVFLLTAPLGFAVQAYNRLQKRAS